MNDSPIRNTAENTRRYSRVSPALPITLRVDGLPERRGILHDISAGGLFVRTKTEGMACGNCDLTITLGPDTEIDIRGEISRVEADGLAVQITEIDGLNAHQHLVNVIRYNASDVEVVENELNIRAASADQGQRIPAIPAGLAVLNIETLSDYTNGDAIFARRLLSMALHELPQQLEAIETALSAGLAPESLRAVHSLKTSSSWIGAEVVAYAAAQVDQQIRNRGTEHAGPALQQLRTCSRQLIHALDSYLRASG